MARVRLLVLGLILLSLQWRLWQPEGLFSVNRLQKKVAAQTEALAADQTRNQRLATQLNWLHHSKAAVEHHARQSLGMVKPGETFYLWIEKE
jgi:cell division protein FtsB